MTPPLDPAFDQLGTPVLAVAPDGRIEAANLACGRRCGVSLRRLAGLPLGALEAEGGALAAALAPGAAPADAASAGVRLRGLRLACPARGPRLAESRPG